MSSDLAEWLSTARDSQTVGEACEESGLPYLSVWASLFQDAPPFVPNRCASEILSTGKNGADFMRVNAMMQSEAWFFDVLFDNIRRAAQHKFARLPVPQYTLTRVELFSRPEFLPGGFLASIKPLDEIYHIPFVADLQAVMLKFHSPLIYQVGENDCDNKARQQDGGFIQMMPGKKPCAGFMRVAGLKSGSPFGHAPLLAICVEGYFVIENDGSVYPLTEDGYNDITNMTVSEGYL